MRLMVRGATQGVERRGKGLPLVLLHAFPLDRRMWERAMAELVLDADVIAVDFPGLGESALRGVTIDDAADDVAALLDALRLERAVLCGVSMGGYVALAFAERHRARLAGLVLADTRAGADSDEQRAARDVAIARIASEGTEEYVAELVPRLVAPGSTAGRDLALALGGLQDKMGVANALAAMRDRPDRSALLPSLGSGGAGGDLPVSVVVGSEDTLTPPAEARRMAAAIPGAEVVEIAGVGHLSAIEDPRRFADAVRALLQRVARVRDSGNVSAKMD